MEALNGFDNEGGGTDHMDSYLGSDEEGLCGSGGYGGGMAGLASFNALGLDDMRDDTALLDGKRGKVRRVAPGYHPNLGPPGQVCAQQSLSPNALLGAPERQASVHGARRARYGAVAGVWWWKLPALACMARTQ